MHSPQPVQRSRNSCSGRAPGGRMSAGLKVLPRACGVMRMAARVTMPPIAAAIMPRRPRSIDSTRGSLRQGRTSWKPRLSRRQDSEQSMQPRHSMGFQAPPGPTAAAPWQDMPQRSQRLQDFGLTLRRNRGRQERTPKSAPRGQRYRHQNRGRQAFRATIIAKKANIKPPPI